MADTLEGSLAHIPGLTEYLAMKRYLGDQAQREQGQQEQAKFIQERQALGQNPNAQSLIDLGMRYSSPQDLMRYGQASQDRQAAIAQKADAVDKLVDFKIQNMNANLEATLRRITNEEHRTELRNAVDQQKNEILKMREDIRRELGVNKPSSQENATYSAGLREVAKDEKDIASVNQIENAVKRWQELQPNVPTGRVAGYRPAVGQPQYQQMLQLENYLAVNNFKPGQGQISNFERQLIKGAGPSTMNDPQANMDITNVMLGAVQNARDRASYREWYLDKNKKLLGADKEWNEYIEKNPRFVSGQGGQVVQNPKRQDWMTYFSAKPASKGVQAGAPEGVDPKVWGVMTPQERALWQK